MNALLIWSGVALGGMAVVSGGLGWAVAGRALRPLRAIAATAREVSASSLDRRLALQGPHDEIHELGATFNDLLARLEASFRSQRQFIANASHELRSPLARQRAIAQVALADPNATTAALRAAHERVLVAGAEEERLLEALLTLARGQAGVERPELLDLARIAKEVLVSRHAEAEGRGIAVRSALSPAWASGDRHLVERLAANLVDNALLHNVDAGWVEISTSSRAGRAVLSVLNSGPELPESELDRLLEPFQRLGPERIGHREGSGLGLSIVKAIAEAHGATLSLGPRPGGGLEVEVEFAGVTSADAD